MEQRIVGKSGLRVSSIGLGGNNFGWSIDEAASRAVIGRALDLGITLFDTAPVYGPKGGESETILGNALGERRKDVVLVTKFGLPMGFVGGPNTSRTKVVEGLEGSLRRLKTDYIDLFMLHWPDGVTPIEETLRALDDAVCAGKVRYIGCCNMAAWKIVEAKWVSRTERLSQFIVAQDEYSLIVRKAEKDLIPALQDYGSGLMPYSPLASGLLSGKYTKGEAPSSDSRLGRNFFNAGDAFLTEKRLALATNLDAFARERGHTLLELAFSWLLAKPLVCSVIAGATRPGQVEQNVAAGDWKLSAEELAQIDTICGAA